LKISKYVARVQSVCEGSTDGRSCALGREETDRMDTHLHMVECVSGCGEGGKKDRTQLAAYLLVVGAGTWEDRARKVNMKVIVDLERVLGVRY